MKGCLAITSLLAVVLACNGQLTWRRIEPSNLVPSPRSQFGLGYDPNNNRLYMFGGSDISRRYSDLWTFDLATDTWTMIHGNQPDNTLASPRNRFSVISGFYPQGGAGSNEGLFLVSTGEGDGKVFYRDIWAFNVSRGASVSSWRELPSAGDVPTERYGAAGGIHMNGSALYVTHGFSKRRFSDTLRYDLAAQRWTTVFDGTNEYSATKPHARCLLGSAMVGPEQPVFFGGCLSGGFSGGPCPAADSWVLQTNREWKRLDDCASARQYSAMAGWPGQPGVAVLFGGRETDRSVITNKQAEDNEVDFVNTNTGVWRRLGTAGENVTTGIPVKREGLGMVLISNGVIVFGGLSTSGFMNDMWLLSGNPDAAPTVGSCGPTWFLYQHLHGFFMIISWGILLQAGAFIARYMRGYKSPLWFKLHQVFQIAGAGVSFLGIILVFPGTRALPNFAHGVFGVLILIFSIQQVINGFMRPHTEKGVEPPKRRVYWEYWHKWGGRFFLLLAAINISLGVYLIMAPVAVIVIWFLMFAFWLIAYIVFEIKAFAKGDAE